MERLAGDLANSSTTARESSSTSARTAPVAGFSLLDVEQRAARLGVRDRARARRYAVSRTTAAWSSFAHHSAHTAMAVQMVVVALALFVGHWTLLLWPAAVFLIGWMGFVWFTSLALRRREIALMPRDPSRALLATTLRACVVAFFLVPVAVLPSIDAWLALDVVGGYGRRGVSDAIASLVQETPTRTLVACLVATFLLAPLFVVTDRRRVKSRR